MTHTHAKDQGQRSLGSKVRVIKMDKPMEPIVLPSMLTRSALKLLVPQ